MKLWTNNSLTYVSYRNQPFDLQWKSNSPRNIMIGWNGLWCWLLKAKLMRSTEFFNKCEERSMKISQTARYSLLHSNFPYSFYYFLSFFLYFPFNFCFGRSTLVWQHALKSLSLACPSVCLSVTKFSQDWIISLFQYCTWW